MPTVVRSADHLPTHVLMLSPERGVWSFGLRG